MDDESPSRSRIEELDRKLKVLTYCVEEKTDDNDSLWRRIHAFQEETVRKLAQPVQVRPEDLTHVDPQDEQSDVAVQQALVLAFERRIAELSVVLDQLAVDNVRLQHQWSVLIGAKQTNRDPSSQDLTALTNNKATTAVAPVVAAAAAAAAVAAPAASSASTAITATTATTTTTTAVPKKEDQDELKVLRFSLKRKERLVAQLEARITKQRDAKRALAEDNSQYESRLVQLQSDMDMALEKEAARRRDAERALQKLRKRVLDIEKKVSRRKKKSSSQDADAAKTEKTSDAKEPDDTGSSDQSGEVRDDDEESSSSGSSSNSSGDDDDDDDEVEPEQTTTAVAVVEELPTSE